jgi:hypothetical protein
MIKRIIAVPRERLSTPSSVLLPIGKANSKAVGRIKLPVATNIIELMVCATQSLNFDSG